MKNFKMIAAATCLIVTGAAASAATYDQTLFCGSLAALANDQKQITVPVADETLKPIYINAGLESRLDSAMYGAMISGEGDLAPFNGWLSEECDGLSLVTN